MSSSRPISSVLLPAVLLGVIGWSLTNNLEAGLNRTLWLLLAVGIWIGIRRWNGSRLSPDERILLAAVSGLSIALLWRDNEMLIALNTMAIAISFGLLPLAAREERSRLWDLRVWEVIESGIRFVASLALGLIPELVEAHRDRERVSGRSVFGPLVRGAIFCAILLPIFGSLLAQADADFRHFLERMLTFDQVDIMQELVLIVACSWLAAGILSGAMIRRERFTLDLAMIGGQLGAIEIGMVLGALNLLFAAFIGFQVSHFFGGAAEVANAAGLTLSSYAREGFFQLVVVAALVVPVLLFFESRVREVGGSAVSLYRWLALVMVGLVFAIMASAMQRMVLYQREFGLTVDRFFASAAMAGIAVTIVWFAVTVLRGASQRFAGGFLVAWAAWLGLLNIANPERIIVESNMARIGSGAPLDIGHLAQLHGDAVPAIVEHLDQLTSADREELLRRLSKKEFSDEGDWRAWQVARSRAYRLLKALAPKAVDVGAEHLLCEVDCRLAYRVSGMRSLSRPGSTPDARLWAVMLTARFDSAAGGLAQNNTSTPVPRLATVTLTDGSGRHYFAAAGSEVEQLSRSLAPGESVDITLMFELPAGAEPAWVQIERTTFALPDA
jgi:hypothetical protein